MLRFRSTIILLFLKIAIDAGTNVLIFIINDLYSLNQTVSQNKNKQFLKTS